MSGVLLLEAARRVPARLPGNFLLLAQKKVTKEEGLNRIPPLHLLKARTTFTAACLDFFCQGTVVPLASL